MFGQKNVWSKNERKRALKNINTYQLMNEDEYLMKNYGDRGGCYMRITPYEISIILHVIRKPNSIIVLLFIQNSSKFKNIAKTSLPASMLSLSSIVHV